MIKGRLQLLSAALLVVLVLASACRNSVGAPSQSGTQSPPIMSTAVGESIAAPTDAPAPSLGQSGNTSTVPVRADLEAALMINYGSAKPTQWGEQVTGVKTRLDTRDKVVALTLDACGGNAGNDVDRKLLEYLLAEMVPATLFVNSRWIDENKAVFEKLSENSLFEIENHGTVHCPLSLTGRAAYGVKGTVGVTGVLDEVLTNLDKITAITGRAPRFFRSGTAYYDEVSVKIVNAMNIQVAGYSLLGDAGATYPAETVTRVCLAAKPGDIILCHMNHPEKGTAEGLIAAIPKLRDEGFTFVRLDAYPLK